MIRWHVTVESGDVAATYAIAASYSRKEARNLALREFDKDVSMESANRAEYAQVTRIKLGS